MAYDAPGQADRLSDELAARWNERIAAAYEGHRRLHRRFFSLDPGALAEPRANDGVTWPAAPLEPTFCAEEQTVRALCDWGVRGRRTLHGEYCEYAVMRRRDGAGRLRPKRIQVTTELRDYWLTLATHDPRQLRAAAADALGREPAWEELYGVADPVRLGEDERRRRFAAADALNAENALFMIHPINGLGDLLFIVLFGARRYAVRGPDGELRRAERDDVLAQQPELACRHADPAVALAVYGAVLAGRAVGFADPLGMYLRPFNHRLLEYAGEPIPEAWVRWGRGRAGMFQRLELGPGDDDDAFLDEIELSVGQERQRLRSGYQLLKMLEVGPRLLSGATAPASEDEFELLAAGEPIECHRGKACEKLAMLEREHRTAKPMPDPAPKPAAG